MEETVKKTDKNGTVKSAAKTTKQRAQERPNTKVSSNDNGGKTVFDPPAPGQYVAKAIDRAFKAYMARLTFGLSPAGMANMTNRWLSHLAMSPGKQMELVEKAQRKMMKFGVHAMHGGFFGGCCIEPLPIDKRHKSEGWQRWPFNMMYQSFLLTQQWWHNATTDIDGLSQLEEDRISFTVRQILDRFAPANFILTNPDVLKVTLEQGGTNLIAGMEHFIEDIQRTLAGQKPAGTEDFQVGRDVAVTKGKVIFRNHLIELIQYSPTTQTVASEPVLIIPAWIMKYYILDLSPENSLVKYLVDQGHTVFMVSWRNPTSEDRDLGMEDYRKAGVMAAIDAVSDIIPDQKIHAVGYCLGGTLLSIAAAAMARDADDRLASMTNFATQIDFTEAGELMLFIHESEVDYLESMMWDQGFLDGYQMAGAFQILRSSDLIWSRMTTEYLMGERQPMNDLMAWNADLTRMPYRMHSEYLRGLFLNNDLSGGRYLADGYPVNIADIRVPIFSVGTVRDHVAPWQSVYKISFNPATDVTFVLTSGGHNAGIVSEPGHPHRTYQIATKMAGDRYIDPDTWQQSTPYHDGSWWLAWLNWLTEHSGEQVSARTPGNTTARYPALCDAPGTYVLQC
ncbi:PHA/PHB synthase family protein [Thalassospira profundimaris]|uniref:PHA/PHB synthase family protein n=1 Tax=Thalassospira profundimaris TaxID=502049 RepID=UPI0002871F8E|nr:alpha/beta fold hydrolase [Thalassospira profundimaris]EKF08416.1 poly(3-hydroxyalkanoate) polymerase family protein [Thalassospira profundimaris WP0211]